MSYGKVHEGFWIDEKMGAATDPAKLLALYLISGPHRNAIGCARIPAAYMAADLHWDAKKVAAAIRELVGMGFITRDEDSGWTLINNLLKYDPIRGDKAAIGASRLTVIVPKASRVYAALYERLSPIIANELKGHPNASQWSMQPPSKGDESPIEGQSKDTRSPVPFLSPSITNIPASAEGDISEVEVVGSAEAKLAASEIETDFEAWYAAYPRKEGYADALKAYRAARKIADGPTLLAGVHRYVRAKAGVEKKYLKGPGAWLRAERWRDGEPAAVTGPPPKLETPEERRALEARLRAEFEALQERKRVERKGSIGLTPIGAVAAMTDRSAG